VSTITSCALVTSLSQASIMLDLLDGFKKALNKFSSITEIGTVNSVIFKYYPPKANPDVNHPE